MGAPWAGWHAVAIELGAHRAKRRKEPPTMRRIAFTLALCLAVLAGGQPAYPQNLSEDDFDDHGTGLILRPIDGLDGVDSPSRVIHKVKPVVQPPAPAVQAPQPPPAAPKAVKAPPAKVAGRNLVQPGPKPINGKKAVTRLELAAILDRYLDYIKSQKSDLEQKMEAIPIQKGLPPQMLEKLDKLFTDLDGLATEEVNLAKMVKDLSGSVHEQGVEIHKLKIADMVTERRLERLEHATGAARNSGPAPELTDEERDDAGRLMDRVQRLEDLLYQSLTQLAENTTQLAAVDPSAPAAKQKAAGSAKQKAPAGLSRAEPRIPFAAAGGITIGAERQAYRRKLMQRVRQKIDEAEAGSAAGKPSKSSAKATARNSPPVEDQDSDFSESQVSEPEVDEVSSADATDYDDSSFDDESEEDLPDLIEQAKNNL
jgi:hypothetical protein